MPQLSSADEKILELLELKFEEFERNPQALWMHYGSSMPICTLDGKKYQGGSALLLEIFMMKKKYRIPIFVRFTKLKELDLVLKPNQHAVPVSLTEVFAVNNWTGKRLLEIEYNKLSVSEKENYTLLFDTSIQYVFNVEQTSAERTHLSLWNSWQERYAGAPPDYMSGSLGYTELDRLIESTRLYYPSYFEEKPKDALQTKYYCKCAQVLAYLSYKSLPISQNDTLRAEPKLSLLISEITGAFVCAKYSLKSFPNENFLENISTIRKILPRQINPAFLVGQINRTGTVLDRALYFQQDNKYTTQISIKNISEYLEHSHLMSKKVSEKYDLPGFSIKASLKEQREKGAANDLPDESIAPKRGR